MREIGGAVREINDLKRGTVRLGVGPTTLIYLLPRVLRDYVRRFPEIELIVLADRSASIGPEGNEAVRHWVEQA